MVERQLIDPGKLCTLFSRRKPCTCSRTRRWLQRTWSTKRSRLSWLSRKWRWRTITQSGKMYFESRLLLDQNICFRYSTAFQNIVLSHSETFSILILSYTVIFSILTSHHTPWYSPPLPLIINPDNTLTSHHTPWYSPSLPLIIHPDILHSYLSSYTLILPLPLIIHPDITLTCHHTSWYSSSLPLIIHPNILLYYF